MLFNSIEFLIFFIVVLAVYTLLRHHWTLRKVFLLACSYVFYMAWNPPFVLLLLFSTGLDYIAARQIARAKLKRARVAWLIASLIGNLGVLAFFKYSDFLLSNLWVVMPDAVDYPRWVSHLVLPMGISFYTFQSLSYTIDVYRDKASLSESFLDFALYVSFFPQLVAGPIIRSSQFLPQLTENREVSAKDVLCGMDQVFRGFAKKIILADTLSVYVDAVYAAPEHYGALNHLLAIYAYAFQIYFDFSGYSDIAIGTARILGLRVPENFRSPYVACGPADFWTRWHISLSTWLRDYLYISAGGSRRGRLFTYRNLFITMLLGGLWHGAAWNFVIWGAFHGIWLAIHRSLFRDRTIFRVPRLVSVVFTFHLVCLGWIFFRAQSLDVILIVLRNLGNFDLPVYWISIEVVFCILLGFASHYLGGIRLLQQVWANTFFGIKAAWYVVIVIGMFLFRVTAESQFIYFQF